MYMKNPTYLYLGLWRKTDKLDFHAPWLDLSLGVSILKLNQFQKFLSNCPCLYHCKLSTSIWRCDRCHCLWLVLEPQVYLKSKIILRNANIIIITCSWRFSRILYLIILLVDNVVILKNQNSVFSCPSTMRRNFWNLFILRP